jgi:CheY-like chemotaxis protein/anti-sigma regulatory factor (Ser/Thr protein kinase)
MAAVGTLAGGIAHDFNNILQAILGYCTVARASDFEDKELLARCFTQIEKGGKRAADLVDQLLTFSRSQETAHEAVSLAPIVLEAVKLLRSILPSIIEIVVDIAENCGPVVTNSTEMHQILMNLCANAAQAMEENGGTIRLTMHDVSIDESALTDSGDLQAGNYVLLTVEDSGPGIPPGDLARIFEPFFTTKEPGKGTGLGLATVHGLVTSMGGVIGVESELGRGAVFRIYFPRSEDLAVESERHDVEQGSVPNKPGRVLVVDDEEAITELLVTMLEARGYAVDAYNDVAAALAVFRVDPRAYDVAILDYTMPGKTGVELAREFFAFNPELPVILATGHLDVAGALSDSPNIVETMKKPYGMDDLVEALNRAL